MTGTADDLALLTGDDAGEVLAAALAPEGGVLRSWEARSVDARPHRGTTVSYRAEAEFPGASVRTVWLGASTRPLPGSASGALVLSDGQRSVAVWAWPHDPWLPGLPVACDASAVGALLESFGAAPAAVRLQVHAYRPGRRAVLQGRSSTGEVFVKVQRPDRVQVLHERHRLLASAGLPVPRSLGVDPRGLVALEALPGRPLRDQLRRHAPVPSAADVLALLDQLPAAVLDLPARPGWTDGAQHYASVIGAAVAAAGHPGEGTRAARLADEVLDGLAGTDDRPEPTHGDLYEAQLLVDDDGRITGLLDLDSTGPGRRADDLACLLAHLELLAHLQPDHAASTRTVRQQWQVAFEDRVDARELRLRTAGVLLSLATGPHRTQEPGWVQATSARLDLVQTWLASAGQAARATV